MKTTKNKKTIILAVNEKDYEVAVGSNETLAGVLRERLGLTGTKIGCNGGECGACTVLIDGSAVVSCLILAIECEGVNIMTIEGLEDTKSGELDPIQRSFMDNFGIQCGFCTPGMVMSAKALFLKNRMPTEEEIKEGIQGNLCRCTGYSQIIDSILAAGNILRGE